MKNHDFQELVDQNLSGLAFTRRQKVLRMIDKEEQPVKKLSTGVILVIALLVLTMTAALATGGFGMLDYKKNQTENEEFTQRILSVGQRFENDCITLTLSDAVFDGVRLSATMELHSKDEAHPVYLYPQITAEANGQPLTTRIESSRGDFSSGFWLPDTTLLAITDGQYAVDVALVDEAGEYVQHAGEVTWHIAFDVLRPNYPVSVAEIRLPADDSDEELTEEKEKAYDRQFADAYAHQRILVSQFGSLAPYIAQLPQLEGVALGEKSWAELLDELAQSGAFTVIDRPVFDVTLPGYEGADLGAGQIFDFGDGWHAKLTSLLVTFDRVDYRMYITRTAPDGLTAAQMCVNGQEVWDIAVLAEGAKTIPWATSRGVDSNEDGSLAGDGYWVSGQFELTAPASRIIFVPCRSQETWKGAPAKDGYVPTYSTENMVYEAQAPYTEEQKAISFGVDAK